MSVDHRGEAIRDQRRRIIEVISLLGVGEVVSYGDIAESAGLPGRARLVGNILADASAEVAWWRVVTASGRLVPGLEAEQGALLGAECVEVHNGRVRRAPRGRFSRCP